MRKTVIASLVLSVGLLDRGLAARVPELEPEIAAIARGFRGELAFAARNLTGEQTLGLRENQPVRTASVIKLPVMVEAFWQAKEGKLRLDDTVVLEADARVGGSGILQDLTPGLHLTLQDAVTLMMVLSDNTATNLVLDRVGIENVNRRMQSLGLESTRIFKKVFRAADRPLSDREKAFGLGSTTPAEMLRLLERIHRRDVVDAPSCERMLAILKKQRDRDQIPRLLAGQSRIEFAGKSGTLEDLRNDVGIVYAPGATIAIAAFADKSPDRRWWSPDNEASLTIARLARALYDAWARPGAQGTPPPAGPSSAAYDLVIRNGRVVDGTGNPWFLADVAVKDGKIAGVGALAGAEARRTIDASGKVVAPGFIDVHTHVESGVVRIPTADNFVTDGVTTVITGNCGGSRSDLRAFFAELERGGISLNLGSLIGHNSVRSSVMGRANRTSTPEELEAMRRLVAENMEAGAVGFSTGLIYIPGTYSSSDEVVELGKVAGRYGGVYATHMRDEGDRIFDAIAEALRVGREGRMPVEISHFKISFKPSWGNSDKTLAAVEQARREGLEVTVDQYPYRASSTGLDVLLPSWALADDAAKVKERLSDPVTRRKIAGEMRDRLRKQKRKHIDYAFVARNRSDPATEGKNITEITKMKGRRARLEDEIETVLDLVLGSVGSDRISAVYFSMSDEDVERIMQAPFAMVASDAGVIEFGAGVPHPRGYGTNARSLGEYVRNRRILGLEDAIRKMTSLPAQTFRLAGRGIVRKGAWADLVVFDPERVKDAATFDKPHHYSEGFAAVVVNGEPVVLDGKHTGARPGKIVYGPGRKETP